MFRTPITACVVTLNEERCIGACLDSLRICDEIIVVDAHSTDRTREIAALHGARVVERDWTGHRTQKQFAMNLASNDWIISIDADERVSPQLAAEILRMRQHGLGEYSAYAMPLLASYFGRPMHHGDWSPDCHLRLFNRRRVSIRGETNDARIVAHGPVGRMRGNILDDTSRDLDEQLGQFDRYARLTSPAMLARGQRTGALRLFFEPAWRFLRAYIWKQGYLDGWRGFAVAQIEAKHVWEKYLRLYIAERAPRGLSNDTARIE